MERKERKKRRRGAENGKRRRKTVYAPTRAEGVMRREREERLRRSRKELHKKYGKALTELAGL